jgi:RNA-binding protein
VSPLSSSQRKQLRGLAHALEPVVHVGKGGASDEVVAQVDRMLDIHELIKLRFVAGKAEKAALVDELCARTGAESAGTVGHVAILFRPQADPEKRRIRLAP